MNLRDDRKTALRPILVRALVPVLLYAIVVGCLTWPLAAHITTHRPAGMVGGRDFDSLYSAWALAWESHVLASGSLHVGNANIYYPEPDSLFYGPVAFGALPYFAPVYLLTGNPTLALNLLLLSCLTLTAALVHLVVYAWTRLHSAGLVAAVALLANRWLLTTFVPGVPHIAVLCYFPLIIFLSSRPSLTGPRTLVLGLLVVAQGMTDALYVAPSVLIPLALVAIFNLPRRRTRARGGRLLLVVVAAGAILSIVHAPYLVIATRNPNLSQQTNWIIDPQRVALELPWGLMELTSPLAMASLTPVLVLTGALVAALRWRGTPRESSAWRHCLLWVATSIVISLPGHIAWHGQLYALPHLQLTQFSSVAARLLTHSERLRVAAMVGIALLAGLAFAEILRQCHLSGAASNGKRVLQGALALFVCAAMYVQYEWAVAQPSSYGLWRLSVYPGWEGPRDSPVVDALRTIGGPTVEVPLLRVADPEANATAMFRSIFHWQPLLNGYASFWPSRFLDLMRTTTWLPDPEAVTSLRLQTGLAFIVMRKWNKPGVKDPLAARRAEWMSLAQTGRDDLELIAEDDELLLFRVTDEANHYRLESKQYPESRNLCAP